MNMPSPNTPRIRRNSRELDACAEIIVSSRALKTPLAWNSRFYGHAVPGNEMCDVGTCPDDFSGAFVAEDVRCVYGEGTDATCVPEVDVGAGIRNELLRSWEERVW